MKSKKYKSNQKYVFNGGKRYDFHFLIVTEFDLIFV